MTATLSHIHIFPVKALDPCFVEQAVVLPCGALQHDRRFALVDDKGNYINGKRTLLIHRLRSSFDFQTDRLTLTRDGQAKNFDMQSDRAAAETWLTDYFAMPIRVRENNDQGFPDDTVAPGPTLVSKATLEKVASWFPKLTLEEVRLRFRINLEIDGVEPFWEDRLYGEPGQAVPFQIGDVVFEGVNPCQRCPVPTRNPWTGEAISGFGAAFAEQRRRQLPPWAAVSRFDHYYRLAVNTRLARRGSGVIRLGDAVTICV